MDPVTITGAIICIGLFAWTIHSWAKIALGDKGAKGFDNLIVNFFSSTLGVAARILSDLEGSLAPVVQAFVTAFQRGGAPLAAEIRKPVEGFVQGIFNETTSVLEALGESDPDKAVVAAAAAMSQAFGSGFASFGVSAAFESVFPEKLNVLNGAGPMLAELAGFAEVAAAVRDPLYHNAFGKSLEYHYRSKFKPELPNEGDAVEWHSRGLLTDAQLRVLFDFSGLKTEYEPAFIASAYRPVSAFIMLRLLESGVISEPVVRDALKFNGYRDQDIQALIDYSAWASLTSYRGQYLSAVITAAERGTISDAEVDSSLQTMQAPAGAAAFVHLTIATRKLEQLAEIYRKSVSEAYKYGLITDADYVLHLEAIGIAAADAQAHYAVDSIAKQGRALLAAEREAAAAARRLEAAAVRAALAEYRAGNIDEAALTAALIAAGMDPALAGFATAYATARQQGAQVIVHGKLVDRADAQALREQVAAIEAQTKKKLLTPDQALNELAALEVPGPNRNALVAAWAAQAWKTVLPV